MTITVCDKCGKKLENNSQKWVSSNTYNYCENKSKMKIKGQVVVLKINISLKCGDFLEICNSCADKIIRKKVTSL